MKGLLQHLHNFRLNIREIRANSCRNYELAKAAYLDEVMRQERYRDEKRLTRYGYRAYCQNDEDGIIAEIFRRIGTTSRTFIEFGIGDGSECNTLNLLVGGWRGLWLEGDPGRAARARAVFQGAIERKQLTVSQALVTVENINSVLSENAPARSVDLLSIDVDGNDYWLWRALTAVDARVVVIEYNALWRPPLSITMRYQEPYKWSLQRHSGASLCAMEKLGRDKGYSLVGTSFAGVNAFFVRADLCGENFCAPFTADNHYEPNRSFLGGYPDWPPEGIDFLETV